MFLNTLSHNISGATFNDLKVTQYQRLMQTTEFCNSLMMETKTFFSPRLMIASAAWENGIMNLESVSHRDAPGPKFKILEIQNYL